jgi:hypothetical protein
MDLPRSRYVVSDPVAITGAIGGAIEFDGEGEVNEPERQANPSEGHSTTYKGVHHGDP